MLINLKRADMTLLVEMLLKFLSTQGTLEKISDNSQILPE